MSFLNTLLALGLSALVTANPLLDKVMTPAWATTENYLELPGTQEDLGTVGHYKIVPAIWVGQIFPDQPKVTIRGRTVEAIFKYLDEVNPSGKVAAPPTTKVRSIETRSNEVADAFTHDCTITGAGYPCFIICNRDEFGYGGQNAMDEGIVYLRSHWSQGSLAHVYGGKGSCNRLTCSWDSAIFYCNDGTRGQDDQYILFTEIGDYAQDIRTVCSTSRRSDLNGQRFRTDLEYSVLFAKSDSHC